MALLVADSRSEKFDKPPPPKKKWIQNYLEKDLRDDAESSEGSSDEATKKASPSGAIVSSVISQFQDYIHQQTNKIQQNTSTSSIQPEQINAGQIAKLLDPKKGGEKFNDSLQKISKTETSNLSQKEIGGVVQGVISQFLNGSLNDHPFSNRSSRKRCRRHDKCPSRSHRSRDRHYHHHTQEEPPVKFSRRSSPESSSHYVEDGGVLNLSLPKPKDSSEPTRVTFAAEDSCYSSDSQRSMEISKSQRMYYADEALDLGLKHAGSRHIQYHPNHFHAQSRPGSQSYPTDGYIKPVPLSILIKTPTSLSPEGSPRASPAPVNLIKSADRENHVPINMTDKKIVPGVVKPVRYQYSSSPPLSSCPEKPPVAPKFTIKPASQQQYSEPVKNIHPVSCEPKTLPDVRKEASLAASAGRRKQPSSNPEKQSTEKASSSSKATASTTREIHNQLEKNRRAQLKLCFEDLASECQIDPKTKASNLTVIRTAYKVVMGLRRDERENERELAKLAQEKIKLTQQLEELRRQYPGVLLESDD